MSKKLTQRQIKLVEETFAKLANVDQKEQEKKLLSGMALVVNNLRKPEVLGPALANLGKNHQKYGAVAEHYPAVAETLFEVMSEFAGDLWTDEVKQVSGQMH